MPAGDDPVSSRLLGLVEGGIGRRHERLPAVVAPAGDHAEARRHVEDHPVTDGNGRVGDGHAQFLGEGDDAVQPPAAHQHHELLAAEAGDELARIAPAA